MKTLLLALLAPSLAFAQGDWGSSGGGEFLRDQYNPWFLKGVSEVRYCLELDAPGFSATAAQAQSLTARALAYWQGELAGRAEDLGIGTQTFTLTNPGLATPCAGDEDLTLKFGYATLGAAELKRFTDNGEDPLDYLGIAMRTAYDKEKLRGKGYVFIASDRGAFAYSHGIDKGLWSYEGLLFRILQHELGHVFGISHTDDGFMAADFPETMVRSYRQYRMIDAKPFFEPASVLDTCQASPCVHAETKDHWASFQLSSYSDSRELTPIGTVAQGLRTSTRLIFPLKVFLPKEQRIFSVPAGTTMLKGPSRQAFNVMGTLETPKGEKKPVLLELRPEGGDAYFDDGKGFERH